MYKNLYKGKVFVCQDFERFFLSIGIVFSNINFTDKVVIFSIRILFWELQIFLYYKKK